MASPLRLHITCSEYVFLCVQISLSCKTTSHIGLQCILISHFNAITSIKTLFTNEVTFWGTRGLGLQRTFGEHNTTHNISLTVKPTKQGQEGAKYSYCRLQREPTLRSGLGQPSGPAPQGSLRFVTTAVSMGGASAGSPVGTASCNWEKGGPTESCCYALTITSPFFLR